MAMEDAWSIGQALAEAPDPISALRRYSVSRVQRDVASRTFARKRDAQEWERRQVDGLRSGVWSDPGAAERPVQDWCDAWLAAQPPRAPATERKIREAINKRIAKTFGRRPAISVRPSEVRTLCADLARTQSPATARHSLGVLRRVFDYAMQDGAIPRNPATGIRLPKVQGNEPQPLTHTELWQLAEQFDSRRDRVLIVVVGYCGLRWGELAAGSPATYWACRRGGWTSSSRRWVSPACPSRRCQ